MSSSSSQVGGGGDYPPVQMLAVTTELAIPGPSGGLGLPSMDLLRLAAYLGSAGRNLASLDLLFGVSKNEDATRLLYPELEATLLLVKEIDLRHKAVGGGTPGIQNLSLLALGAKPAHGLQALATEAIMAATIFVHRSKLSNRDCSLFDARASLGASAWMNLSRARCDHALTDKELLILIYASSSMAIPARFASHTPIRGAPRLGLAPTGTCRGWTGCVFQVSWVKSGVSDSTKRNP